jgi:repressor LexA
VLRALAGYQQRHGYPPALRELGRLVGIHSPSTVSHYLATLEDKGYVRRAPRLPRAVAVIRLPDVTEPLQAAAPASAGGDTLR